MYRPKPEDFDDFHVMAASAEPMQRADHKAKKHGRPKHAKRYPRQERTGEKIGGGHFVFRRGDSTGRIRPCEWPFEHPNMESARQEAERLHGEYGGVFDVVSVSATVGIAIDEEWDRVPQQVAA